MAKQNAVKTVEDRIREVIVDLLMVDDEQVTRSADLEYDLNADSLDRVELIMNIEEELGIKVDEAKAEKWRTVGQLVDGISGIVGKGSSA